jgi:hypothetical protein
MALSQSLLLRLHQRDSLFESSVLLAGFFQALDHLLGFLSVLVMLS